MLRPTLLLPCIALSLVWLPATLSAAEETSALTLIRDRKAVAAVVLPDQASASLRRLAERFTATLQRATGAVLPIVEERQVTISPETAYLFIGDTQRAKEEGLSPAELPEESYRIARRGNALFITARENPQAPDEARLHPVSQPIRWALNRLLEDSAGVRWLWPGELGTYVPDRPTVAIPTTDLQDRPKLRSRQLVPAWTLKAARRDRPPTGRLTTEETQEIIMREATVIRASIDWLEDHQGGERDDVPMPSHAFTRWWAKYGKEHPDYFAQPPPGEKLAIQRPGAIKLRLSNPAVIEQIAKEYQAAGAPRYWPVTPNDAAGYDTSSETLAWDLPQGQPIMDIWRGRANLTARYITFWNLLHDRLKQINPEVTLTAYAYSAYRNPPPPERKLTARMKFGVVPGYQPKDHALWEGWARLVPESGMVLRPNWWHLRANAPHLPLNEIASYIRFTQQHQLDGIRMDSITGFWATKGPSYYLVARLITQPHLSKDEILAEYTSAFGRGASKISAYLDYWQQVTTEQDAYRSSVPEIQTFLNEVKKGIYNLNSSGDQSLLIVHLYPDTVVAPAEKLLDEAAELIGNSDRDALARVEFLRDGLRELKATRNTIALGLKLNEQRMANQPHDSEILAAFKESSEALISLRKGMSERHAIWAGAVQRHEYNRRIPTEPRTLTSPKILGRNPVPEVSDDFNDV